MRTRTGGGFVRPAAIGAVAFGALLAAEHGLAAPEFALEAPARREVRQLVAERLGDLDVAARRDVARRKGALRIRGRRHLEGRILADSLTIAPGADVSIAPGTTIWVRGDIAIHASVRTSEPVVSEGPKAAIAGPRDYRANPPGAIVGASGTDNVDIVFICEEGDFDTDQPLLGGDGGAGGSVSLTDQPDGTTVVGGRGGKGVGFVIDCPDGVVTIGHNVVPGRGGAGGNATVTGASATPGTGDDGAGVEACGGDGGDSGDVRIVCRKIVFPLDNDGKPLGKIGIRAGGVGGRAEAAGGAGAPMVSCDDGVRPGDGGDAGAFGGWGGTSTLGIIEAEEIEPAGFDARDIISFEDVLEYPDGGTADALGGPGGAAADCANPPGFCPARGKDGFDGGRGGDALAVGGEGGFGGRIGAGKGDALFRKIQSGAEAFHGSGGAAFARSGDGGAGGDGADGQKPGKGGAGGAGGDARATGGRGGGSKLKSKGGIRFKLPSGLIASGDGGDAATRSGDGGDGGDGGNCCGRPGGKGGKGGKGGRAGDTRTRGGRAGATSRRGPKGESGEREFTFGRDGAFGVRGLGCGPTGVPGLDASVSGEGLIVGEPDILLVELTNQGDADVTDLGVELLVGGDVVLSMTTSVPAASDGAPGRTTLPANFLPEKKGKVKAELQINGTTALRTRLNVKSGGGGGGGCGDVIDGNDVGTFSIVILDGGTEVVGGETNGPIPVGRTLSIGGSLFKDNATVLENVRLEVRIDGQTVFSDTIAGPIGKLATVEPQFFSLPSAGPGCIEIYMNGILDQRRSVGVR